MKPRVSFSVSAGFFGMDYWLNDDEKSPFLRLDICFNV